MGSEPMTTALAWGRSLCAALALVSLATQSSEPAANRLIAFVGQKLKVEPFEPPACEQQSKPGHETICIVMDSAFHAKYRVLKLVHGRYDEAVIDFDAFDHFGWPPFANYEHVLLFVSRHADGTWYHVKYQYFPVYETRDGDWATCGSADRFEPPSRRGASTARPIAFKNPVIEPLPNLPADQVEEWFPTTDWARIKDHAVCLQGTPIADLFEAKKRGVLRARGLFE